MDTPVKNTSHNAGSIAPNPGAAGARAKADGKHIERKRRTDVIARELNCGVGTVCRAYQRVEVVAAGDGT